MRTKEEIKKEIKKGEAFVERHPESMFGTDNTKGFKLFKRLTQMFLDGKSIKEIEAFIEETYDDEDYSNAQSVVEWLRRTENEEFYY